MKKFLLVSLAILMVGCGKRKPPYSKSSLSEFIYKKNPPVGCLRYSTDRKNSFPFNIASNPYLSSNPEFVKSFAGQLLNYDQTLTSAVTSGLFSVFDGEHEIGLFGLEFDSERSAAVADSLLKSDNPDLSRFRVFQKNKLLIQLWSIDTNDSCFVALSAAIITKLGS